MGDRGHNRHGPKRGGGCAPFAGVRTRLVQCSLSRGLLPYQAASSSIQPFGHNRHGPKMRWEWVCPFFWGSWVHIQHNVAQAEAYLHTKWHHDTSSRLATINMGRKLGGSAPCWGAGTGSPSNTKSPGLRPTSIPSGILIHRAVWPQQKWAENWGGKLRHLLGGVLGPHLTQSRLG